MLKKFMFLMLLTTTILIWSENVEIDSRLLENPILGHYLSIEEIYSQMDYNRDFYETDPPDSPVRNIAEFEKMEGVLIRYPFGISLQIIAEMSEDVMVTTIVSSTSQQNTVTTQYSNAGVNLANCNFLIAPSDSYWTRDYGPWYVVDGNHQVGIVNFPYNRPRPNDNDIPIEVAEFLEIELYGMNVIHTGGNYMTDGMGISASTTLVYTENNIPDEEVNQRMSDFLGIHTYHVLNDPLGDYIEHIDCWGKFLDVDKVLIGEVPSSDPRYNDYEAVADYFASSISSYGSPYQVYRVYEPSGQPYTNSLILNNKVLVPITNSSWDDDALAVYEEAMPGYEVIGFTGSWESTDALHCRTKGIADRNMLYIKHLPHFYFAPSGQDYLIEAEIIPYSGEALLNDSLLIHYRTDDGEYLSLPLTQISENNYQGYIPEQPLNTQISYYLSAADESGSTATHPFIGTPDPHIFVSGAPDIMLESFSTDLELEEGSNTTDLFTIYNEGIFDLNVSINYQAGERDLFEYQIPNSPYPATYDYNTYDEQGWTDYLIEDEFVINQWSISYHWSTDNWPEEGSFLVESPSGTVFVIGAGEGYGDYTKTTSVFRGEPVNGNWKLWIQDSYGDGGHRATNITMSLTDLPPEEAWLTVDPTSTTIEPQGSCDINFTCDALELEAGDYLGMINISSNDPDESLVTFTINLAVTSGSATDPEELPILTRLIGNYPNPFNPNTKIAFALAHKENVSLKIYNTKGQKVRSLIQGELESGNHEIAWEGIDDNGKNVSSGIFFYKLDAGDFTSVKKMILLR